MVFFPFHSRTLGHRVFLERLDLALGMDSYRHEGEETISEKVSRIR